MVVSVQSKTQNSKKKGGRQKNEIKIQFLNLIKSFTLLSQGT
jgi:hypothetical protein